MVTNWYYWPWWSKVPVSSHTGQNIRECFWTFKRTNFILIHINLIYPLWKMWSLEDPETNHNVLRGGCRYLFQIENKIHLMGYFSPYITWDKQSTRELWPGSKCSILHSNCHKYLKHIFFSPHIFDVLPQLQHGEYLTENIETVIHKMA